MAETTDKTGCLSRCVSFTRLVCNPLLQRMAGTVLRNDGLNAASVWPVILVRTHVRDHSCPYDTALQLMDIRRRRSNGNFTGPPQSTTSPACQVAFRGSCCGIDMTVSLCAGTPRGEYGSFSSSSSVSRECWTNYSRILTATSRFGVYLSALGSRMKSSTNAVVLSTWRCTYCNGDRAEWSR